MTPVRKDPTARTSLMIAVILHVIAVFVFFVWAAKTGKLDPILKIIQVVPVAKEKPKEAAKPKPEETIKQAELPKINSAPPAQSAPPASANPAVASAAPPPVAPPAAGAADFDFSDGAKEVATSTNAPIDYYRNLIEFAVRANWQRLENVPDEQYQADAEVQIDGKGKIVRYQLLKGSGDEAWDKTVLRALAATREISRPPPKGFPGKFVIRFDVVPDAFAVAP